MKTVLFGWELGANLGHLVPMREVARPLQTDGIRIVVAARDIGYARAVFGPDAIILQAPVWPHHRHHGATGPLAGYPDILAAIGFGEAATLDAMVRSWQALIDLVKPDAIVADHSPALQITLLGSDIPVVAIGTGFTMPPLDGRRFPPLRGDRPFVIPESRLLESVEAVQARRDRPVPASLAAAFRTAARVVFGVPELDPYRSHRREPIAAPPGGLPPAQAWPRERRLFAYLGADLPGLEDVAQALASLDVPVEAYFRGPVGPVREFLRLRGHIVHEDPPPLAEVLARASHVVHQGGAMTAAAAFTAGRPQLILPRHDEARVNAAMLERMGVGTSITLEQTPARLGGQMRAFLADPFLSEKAFEAAQHIRERELLDGQSEAVRSINQHLGTRLGQAGE